MDHAYAITLHKFQGSEIPCVIICLDSLEQMASRNAFYTAFTRGKEEVHIFVAQPIWKRGCCKRENSRETRLAFRLRNAFAECGSSGKVAKK